jgi:hypothetical protein
MGILDGNPKNEPMHYGEIHGVWHFSFKETLSLSAYESFKYHAGDKDLKEIIDDAIKSSRHQIEECNTLLNHNGVTPPPMLPKKPEAKQEQIPIGARFTDQEIAATLALDTATGQVKCSTIMGMAIREDIGALFMKYHTAKAALGLRILRLSKEKGWLIPPPLQIKTPEMVTS